MNLSILMQNRKISFLMIFLLSLFFVFLADGSMSYIFPIVVEEKLSSNFTMGLVLSFSSMVGLACDFLFPQLFKGKSWKFYILSAISTFILFPVFTYLGIQMNSLPIFLLASAVWGIYFELVIFSLQKFIVSTQHKEDFVRDWGNFYVFSNTAKIMAPILGSVFLNLSLNNAPLFVIPIQIIAIFFVVFVAILIKQKHHHVSYEIENPIRHIHLTEEFKYWKVLFPTILPIFISAVTFVCIDAAYWSMGGLFGKETFTNGESSIEWLILIMYMIPNLIGSIIMSRIRMVSGKKRLMNIFLILGGLILSTMFVFGFNQIALLGIIFVSTLIMSIAGGLNEAVFTDLIKRLGKSDIHLIGLNRVTSSLGYIIAPTLLGFVADKFNYISTFSLIGFLASIIGVFLFILTPRKLRINEHAIKELENFETEQNYVDSF